MRNPDSFKEGQGVAVHHSIECLSSENFDKNFLITNC